jgi:hypothetical protein
LAQGQSVAEHAQSRALDAFRPGRFSARTPSGLTWAGFDAWPRGRRLAREAAGSSLRRSLRRGLFGARSLAWREALLERARKVRRVSLGARSEALLERASQAKRDGPCAGPARLARRGAAGMREACEHRPVCLCQAQQSRAEDCSAPARRRDWRHEQRTGAMLVPRNGAMLALSPRAVSSRDCATQCPS